MDDKLKVKMNAYRKVAKSGKVYYRAYRYGVAVTIFPPGREDALGLIVEFDDIEDLPNQILQTGRGGDGSSGFDGIFGAEPARAGMAPTVTTASEDEEVPL